MGDKVFHLGLLILTLVFWLMSGRVREHLWENIFPWIVMLALMVLRDAIVSARALWEEVSRERQQPLVRESDILQPSGRRATIVTPSESNSHDGTKIIGMTVVLSGFVLLSVYLVWQKAQTATTPTPVDTGTTPQLQATEIYIDCHQMALPIHISPMGIGHVKALNKKQFGNTKWAMWDIRNDSGKELLWPDEKILKSGPKSNPGVFGYKCDVTNHATANLIDLAIPLNANFDNEKTPLTYLAVISPLDAGTTFSFYMINECPVNVSVIAPDNATVQVFGEDKRRTVPLYWPHRNPIEQIMMFFPSKVRWTGNSCE